MFLSARLSGSLDSLARLLQTVAPTAVLPGTPGSDSLTGTADDDTILGDAGHDTLIGLDGDDNLDGGDGFDSLSGGLGDDTLLGGNVSDTLDGGDGADLLSGGTGPDQLFGGAGDDTLDGGDGADLLDGGADADRLDGGAGMDTLDGGDGADSLTGGSQADSLTGDTGNDTIEGGQGHDLIDGGNDDDSLLGGIGDDTIQGGLGRDTILGEDGQDSLSGGDDGDTLAGGKGSDTLLGDAGDDSLSGGAQGDLLSGGAGADTVQGDQGHDTIQGDGGNDALMGGIGDDTVQGGLGQDTIEGENGQDMLSGDDGADLLDGGTGHDTLDGGAGSDSLVGGYGDDSLIGGDGADTLDGRRGSDTLDGGQGDDLLIHDPQRASAAAASLSGGDGLDQLDLHLSAATWSDAQFQAELADFLAFVAAQTLPTGEVSSEVFTFDTLNMTVSGIETLIAVVGDVRIDTDPTVFGFVLNGPPSGRFVAAAGDVNGDGIDDILTGSPIGDDTYVVFGRDTAAQGEFAAITDLEALDGTDGFVVTGNEGFNDAGTPIASAGDINGDGIDDILIGASFASPGGADDAGATYVVFGRDTAADGDFAASVDLGVLDGSDGFMLEGVDFKDFSGLSVAAAGDVNGDGIDDILIGAVGADPNGGSSNGEVYVVFGRDTATQGDFTATFELADLDGSNGFVLEGASSVNFAGNAVSSAGDVNGDGIDDILVGAYGASDAGITYVVFGRDTATTGDFAASIDLGDLDGSTGFAILGEDPGDESGWAASSAGDVNGDGIGDILVGAYAADADGVRGAGKSYVVFGRDTAAEGDFAAAIDLGALDGSNGFAVEGISANDVTGGSVASASDVNGDGIDDFLIGTAEDDPAVTVGAGDAYLVFGKDTATQGDFAAAIDLADLDGSDGFVFKGDDGADITGTTVSSAGDVNADGIADILIGVYGASSTGETYVVYGGADSLTEMDAADGVLDGEIQLALLAQADTLA